MVCCSTASKGPLWELQPRVAEGDVVNRVQLDVQAAIPERNRLHRRQLGNSCQEEFTSGDQWQLARYGYTDRCIGCQHARLGLKPADHSEECRARIVRHMTADDDRNQRVQIVQDRIVESAPLEVTTGERDSVPELARKKG